MLNSHILELIRKVVSLAPLVGLVRRPPARPEGITACVRVKGDEEWIEPSLISIQEFADEILVLDNGASPETQKALDRLRDPLGDLLRIERCPHLDLFEVSNLALEKDRSRWVVRWDADFIAHTSETGDIRNLRRYLVGGRSAFFSNPNRTAGKAGFINPWFGRFYQEEAQAVMQCDYVIGCCWLFKKEVLERLGQFDPDYFIMHWEMDLCTRAKQKGYKVYYQPEAIAKHKIPPQGKRSGIYYLYRNKIMYIRKNSSLLPKITSYVLYALFWLPKFLLSSIIFHKGIYIEEIRLILWGVFHGIIGITGQWDVKSSSL